MEEFDDPFVSFGRDVIPLQWFSLTDPNNPSNAIVGLLNAHPIAFSSGVGKYNLFSNEASIELLDVDFFSGFIGADAFDVTRAEKTGTSGTEFEFSIQSNVNIEPFGIAAAFSIQYADLSVGGGTIEIEYPADFLIPGASGDPIEITTSLPRFNEREVDDGAREFWGGTFVEPGTTEYVGQPHLYDDIVLPGSSSEYRSSLDELGNIILTPVNPANDLFGLSYSVQFAENVVFGGDPNDRSDTVDLTEYSDLYKLSSSELQSLVEGFYFASSNVPASRDLMDLMRDLPLAEDELTFEDVLAETLGELDFLDQFDGVDFTDPAEAETVGSRVQTAYSNYLGRGADPEGLAFWSDALSSGAVDQNTFDNAFWEGIHAPTGGAQDQARFDAVWQLVQVLVNEGGLNNEALVGGISEEFKNALLQDAFFTDFGFASDRIAEASDGDGVDDTFTISLQGLLDLPGEGM